MIQSNSGIERGVDTEYFIKGTIHHTSFISKGKHSKMMVSAAILLIFTASNAYGLGNEELSNAQRQLTIYTLTSDLVCSPEMMRYNFTHSVAAAVRFANSLTPVNNAVFFLTASKHCWVPNCPMQEASRAGILYKILQNLQVDFNAICDFHVILIPALQRSCIYSLCISALKVGTQRSFLSASL